MIKFLLFFSSLFLIAFCFGQNSQIKRTNHWYFGGQAGIDFTNGTALADTNGELGAYAGCSSISDAFGTLLLYTNGQTVWNAVHDTMPNGTGLLGLGTPVQSSIIVSKPMDDNIYYIFTCASPSDGSQDGVRYSIVDMSLDGGLGDVTVMNELLFMPSSEQLGATYHSNCVDIWIMAHELNSNKYRAYLLTATGIDTNDVVINDIGNFPIYPVGTGLGLKFSPDAKKMAASNFWDNLNNPLYLDTLDLFDFDNSTGILSNYIKLQDTTILGFNFSPDSKLLYVTNINTNTWILPGYEDIFQYDISSNIQAIIWSSKTLIYQPLYYDFSDFQIGADNSIYIANPFSDTISIIQFPNQSGPGCTIIENAFSLNGKICYTELPNFISSYFNQDSTSGCFYDVGIDESGNKNIRVTSYPNPFNTYTKIVIESAEPMMESMNISITLLDIIGQETLAEIRPTSEGFLLYRNNLPSGIYILNISINNNSYSQKLVISN